MNERLEKMIKKDRTLLILGIAFLFAIAGCVYWIYTISKSDTSKIPQIMEVDKVETLSYLNTRIAPYEFAANQDESEWLAIVMDENNYLYIVRLTSDEYDKIYEYFGRFKDSEEIVPFRIVGHTKEFDSKIQELAIDAYNEGSESEDDVITEDNFNEYFGYFYLDMSSEKDYSIPAVLIFVSSIFSITFLALGLVSTSKTKKTIESEEYQRAIEELNNPEYETKSAILTKNYIIYSNCGLNIVSYKDVTWVYRHTYRYNGVPNHSFAYYVRGSKKMNLISFGFNQKQADDLVAYVSKKNPNALVGYTKENIKAHKENI